ncbi:MAG: EamA family transporter [Rhodoglobus sp.]|nr:EamA family transporter [Rhodoglobus sp.]
MPGIVIQYVAMALSWGSNFFFVAIALQAFGYGQVTWARVVLAALALGAVVLIRRVPLPRRPVMYLHFLVTGVTSCTIPHLAFSWGQQYVGSGLAAIYNSAAPLATAAIAVLLFRIERLTPLRVAGLLLGLGGVVVIIGPWSAGGGGELPGQIACLVAAVSYGFSLVYLRRFVMPHDIPALAVAFLNVAAAAVFSLLLTPALVFQPFEFELLPVLALLVLGIVGTGFSHIWNLNVLRAWGPVAVSTVAYLLPVVAVALGVALLHERLTWNEPVGALIVLVSVLLARGRVRPVAPQPPP